MPKYAETWLTADENGPAYVEPLTFVPSQRDGILIPKPAGTHALWLAKSVSSETLLELAERGRIVGHPIEQLDQLLRGPIEELRLELANRSTAQIARTKLIAFGDRFIRAKIDGTRYLYLNNRILFHLDLTLGQQVTLIFLAVAGTFEIWTMPFYEAVRSDLATTIIEDCMGLRT